MTRRKIIERATRETTTSDMNQTKRVLIPKGWRQLLNFDKNEKVKLTLVEDSETNKYCMLIESR